MEGEEEGQEGGEEAGVAEGLDGLFSPLGPTSLPYNGEGPTGLEEAYVHFRGSFWRWETPGPLGERKQVCWRHIDGPLLVWPQLWLAEYPRWLEKFRRIGSKPPVRLGSGEEMTRLCIP